jgi:hypothetical protein
MTHTPQRALSPERAANLAENPHAGQGPVLLDIGGDIGAVVLHLPSHWEGAEVEYEREDGLPAGQPHEHAHDRDHDHAHGHQHSHEPHSGHRPHVAVVGRPAGGGVAYTAVVPDLLAGRYRLTLPDGSLLGVEVVGGTVTELDRSGDPPAA